LPWKKSFVLQSVKAAVRLVQALSAKLSNRK
jgi:hypothetical protein